MDDHNIVERKITEAKDQLLKNWNSMYAYCDARLSVTQDGKDGEGQAMTWQRETKQWRRASKRLGAEGPMLR